AAASQLDLDKVIATGGAPDVKLTSSVNAFGSVDGRDVAGGPEITDRGGGIGRVEWRVNGVTTGLDNVGQRAGQSARLTRRLALDPGDNSIEVVAYNASNLMASVPERLAVISAAPA